MVGRVVPIRALETYDLEVIAGVDTIRASTRVPGTIELKRLPLVDTLRVRRQFSETLQESLFIAPVTWSGSRNSQFYRMLVERSDFGGVSLDHTFDTTDAAIIYPFDLTHDSAVSTKVVVEAIDSNYALMYWPEAGWSGSDVWKEWFDRKSTQEIESLSTMRGGNRVAGLFGSLNSASASFIAVPGE